MLCLFILLAPLYTKSLCTAVGRSNTDQRQGLCTTAYYCSTVSMLQTPLPGISYMRLYLLFHLRDQWEGQCTAVYLLLLSLSLSLLKHSSKFIINFNCVCLCLFRHLYNTKVLYTAVDHSNHYQWEGLCTTVYYCSAKSTLSSSFYSSCSTVLHYMILKLYVQQCTHSCSAIIIHWSWLDSSTFIY